MQTRNIKLAQGLTYAGTLPLIGLAAAAHLVQNPEAVLLMATAYAAIIAAFISGIHWAIYMFHDEKCPRNLLLTSNMVALLAWASLLLPGPAILVQTLCFLYLLVLDFKLRDAWILPQWFFALRRNATVVVVLALAALALS